jgi:HlyD family secretion protein
MQVEAAIDEADVGRLRTGQAASFTVDAFPRRNFSGEIRQIRKSPQNVQNVISYTVVISAANPDLALLPGMTANVRIVVERRDNVLKVANAALRFRPGGAPEAKPAAEAAPVQQAGGQQAQAFRQRLYEEVKPDESQRAKFEEVFNETRQKMAGVRDVRGDGERRKQLERIRGETRAKLVELLKPEQKPAFERLIAEMGGRGAAPVAGRVWILGAGGELRPVEVRLGLSDGSSTEIAEGPLKEGAEVILGVGEARAEKRIDGFPKARFF